MAERSLKVLPSTSFHEERESWNLMRDQASILVKTGFLPDSIKTPEQAMAIMMKGRELNVPPMYALSNIVIVKGKPSCSAELMLALIRRDHGPDAIRVKETTNQQCVVEWRQKGWSGTQSYSFTIEDANLAGLVASGGMFTKYPAAMLRARCISAVARMAFPESIAGMYSPGELGDEVVITNEGEVVSGGAAPVVGSFDSGIEDDAVDAESRPVDDDRDKANRHYFAVAADYGFTDAANKVFALAHYPQREHGPTTSRKELTADELRKLTAIIENDVAEPSPDEDTGELVISPEVEYANAIAEASDQRRMAEIAAKLSDGGLSATWLKRVWKYRNAQVPA